MESLVTDAAIVAVPFAASEAGGCCVIVTEMGGGAAEIVTVAVTVLVVSFVEVAVIVTVFPDGIAAGAVKVVVALLAV